MASALLVMPLDRKLATGQTNATMVLQVELPVLDNHQTPDSLATRFLSFLFIFGHSLKCVPRHRPRTRSQNSPSYGSHG
jgi:hypothetical protein